MDKELYYATFAFYDEKARRLSVFAEQIDNELHIAVLTCSKSDQFSKKKERELYEMWMASDKKHPDIHMGTHIFRLADKTKPKKEFIQWCRDNFYSVQIIPIRMEGEGPALMRNNEILVKHFLKGLTKAMSHGGL